MKSHELTHEEWNKIRGQIKAEFGNSMTMLRGKMKEELGFTPRDHHYYNVEINRWVNSIHIDFYSEHARTWFLLKYV
jgi:hypothetical protein